VFREFPCSAYSAWNAELPSTLEKSTSDRKGRKLTVLKNPAHVFVARRLQEETQNERTTHCSTVSHCRSSASLDGNNPQPIKQTDLSKVAGEEKCRPANSKIPGPR
jgi:hypothetical protein